MSSMQELPPLGLSHVPVEVPAPAAPRLRLVPDVPLDFDDAVRRITPRLQRYATRRLGDAHEAEELVQEALLRAYKNRAELLTEDDVAAWSTVVVGRLVIDRLRVRGRSVNVAEVPEGTRVGRDTADVVVARDEARMALDALDAMPARQAAVLWAREVEGQGYDEIGARFGMTEPAVRSILTRARKALRKEYATRGGTLPVAGLSAIAPWVVGLRWADRLRAAAGRLAAPAAIGALGLGLIGGALTSPFGGGSATAPTTVQRVVSESVAQTTVQRPAVAPEKVAVAVAPARRATATSRVASATTLTMAETNPLAGTCVGTTNGGRSAGAGTGTCGHVDDRGNHVFLTPTLPDNPTGVRELGVYTDKLDCAVLPDNPLASCTPPSTGGTR